MFFRKKKLQEEIRPETEEICFEFPVYVNVYKPGFDEERGDKPTELTGSEAFGYISEDARAAICWDFEESGLHKYFNRSDAVFGFSMEIGENGVAVVKAVVQKDLSVDVKNDIFRFLEGQMSDGWGEDPDIHYVDDDEANEAYEVFFWKFGGLKGEA